MLKNDLCLHFTLHQCMTCKIRCSAIMHFFLQSRQSQRHKQHFEMKDDFPLIQVLLLVANLDNCTKTITMN